MSVEPDVFDAVQAHGKDKDMKNEEDTFEIIVGIVTLIAFAVIAVGIARGLLLFLA